jgi:hypothetical protein
MKMIFLQAPIAEHNFTKKELLQNVKNLLGNYKYDKSKTLTSVAIERCFT